MSTFTIARLVAMTGVPPATVHSYLRSGLLPEPKHLAPNRFGYDERHVRGLRLIRSLRDDRRLPLPTIKRILPELLRLETTEAFLPEMWDRALALRTSRPNRQPSARLLEAAKDAFASHGYDAVNVDQLCRVARMAKGSFYRYYRSKEALFFAAAESMAADLVSAFTEAAGRRPVPEEDAGPLLARFLEPRLPVFLDLLGRAVQRRPGYPTVAGRVFGLASSGLGSSIEGPGPIHERGGRAIADAVGLILRTATTVAPPVFDSPSRRGAQSTDR
jgi:AcrR family transcriptional regulator